MTGMPGNSRADFTGGLGHVAADNGAISFLHAALGELFGQSLVGLIILGYHQAPARFLIEAVDDSRPRDTAYAAQLPLAVVQQGIH